MGGGGGIIDFSVKENFSLIFERYREKNRVLKLRFLLRFLNPPGIARLPGTTFLSAFLFSEYNRHSFVSIAHENKNNKEW
jgi:hypothetical protein